MERKIKIFSFAAILMLAVSVIGCKHNISTSKVAVTGVTLSKTELTLEEGKSEKLTATVSPATATNTKVTWSSDKADVAEVSQDGTVTAKKAGTAKITVKSEDGGKTADCTVRVTAKSPPPAPKPTYPVTFNVDGAGGTLKATADGVAETETSPITVEHGKTVTFTAAPTAGYKVKEWTLDGTAIAEAGTNTEYTLTVTKPAAVTVSFEPKKALLTLKADKNTVKVKAKTADGKPITVEGCNVNELANEAETTLTVTDSERKLALIGDIIELNCSGEKTPGGNRPLIALNVSGCTALQKLNCQYNQLTALNVQGLTELQELYCNSNKIPELNVQGLTKLQKLDCQGNELSTLNVQGLTALQKLNCRFNKLTALDVSGLTALQELVCNDNQLSTLDVHGLTALQELVCKDNQLSTLDVHGLTELQELACSRNQLTELNVQGCVALQKLVCEGNQLTELNVQGLTALQQLSCPTNQLTTLNVQGCTSLKTLLCYKNKLDADAFTKLFNDLPTREVSDRAKARLYSEGTGVAEGNCTDFTTPESLKKAFDNAKDAKHWKMQKTDGPGFPEDI